MPSTEPDTLAALGVVEAAGRIRAGTLTAAALVEACLGRIEADDDRVRAWVHVDREGARQAARDLDEAAMRGRFRGPLHGIPVGVKDIIDVAGMPTTAGARPWAHRTPTVDATAVARLRAAGAIILGKTATTQFAHRDPAPTRNPWNPAHTPGGSSSGSGAAVAARMVPLALGTQTVGSVLRPAAYCGVVGVKPTHGLVPVEGVVPLAWSLDHVGVLARSVADAALGLGVMAREVAELTAREAPELTVGRELAVRREGAPRLGVARELFARCELATGECLIAAVAALGRAGASLVDVPFPGDLDQLLAAGGLVMQVEAAAYHEADWRRYAAEYGPHLDQLVRDGLAIGGTAYVRANRARLHFRSVVLPLLGSVDALLAPTAPGPAPEGLAWTGDASLCAPWSFAGTPAVTLPAGLVPAREVAGLTARLPVGLQLVAAAGREAELLAVAAWAEHALESCRA